VIRRAATGELWKRVRITDKLDNRLGAFSTLSSGKTAASYAFMPECDSLVNRCGIFDRLQHSSRQACLYFAGWHADIGTEQADYFFEP
jgi:hypothetical protein